jgi:Icc-related predicted phosphoesterase
MQRRWQSDNDAHMRVAVIADVHGNLPALEAALTAAEAAEPDLVVFGGDLV